MRTHDSSEVFAEVLSEVVDRDVYRLRRAGQISTILDCGANVGVFSLYARFLYPEAKIIAIEAMPETFACLLDNCRGMGIDSRNLALGIGPDLFTAKIEGQTSLQLAMLDQATGHRVAGISLVSLVGENDPSSTFLKMDIEGSERRFFMHDESENALRSVGRIAIELHYNPACPGDAESARNWVSRTFSGTHEIEWTDTGHPYHSVACMTANDISRIEKETPQV